MASNHLSSSVINDSEMSRYISGGTGFGITVGVTTDPGLAGEYGSKGKFYWGGAAATIFWIDPEDKIAWNNLANVHYNQGQYERSIEIYKKSLALDPDYVIAVNNIGNALDLSLIHI